MTTQAINRQRLEFAACGFLAEMRRQQTKRFPEQKCSVLTMEEYGPEDRASLMAAVEKVIQMSGPGADLQFAAWLERKAQAQALDPLAT